MECRNDGHLVNDGMFSKRNILLFVFAIAIAYVYLST